MLALYGKLRWGLAGVRDLLNFATVIYMFLLSNINGLPMLHASAFIWLPVTKSYPDRSGVTKTKQEGVAQSVEQRTFNP